MKKLFILFAAVLMAVGAMAQTEVSFMGIPLSYSSEQFILELATKINHALSTEEFEYPYLSATCNFAGFEDCNIRVYPNAEKDKYEKTDDTYRIEVSKAWDSREEMMKLKALYDTKYGIPTCNNSDMRNLECIYIIGNITIEFQLYFEDNFKHPELPTEFFITYTKNSTEKSYLDDI